MSTYDLVDDLLSIEPGSRLDTIRRHRGAARDNIQLAYDALFQPRDAGHLSLIERAALASFVSGLHRQASLSAHYANLLGVIEGGPTLAHHIEGEVLRGATEGPYGHFPAGPLSVEDKTGLDYTPSAAASAALGTRLSAAFTHAHLLVFHPRDAEKADIDALSAAGLSTPAIVTLSQLIAYVSFQVRLIDGLAALAASTPQGGSHLSAAE